MASQGAIQIDVVLNGVSLAIDKKHLSSLQITRNLGDTANKFTLEVFDETAYQLENALAGTAQCPITVRYAASNNWNVGSDSKNASIIFTGVVTDYQISFVGRATMLSLEGVLSATSTGNSTLGWWFKKATINWVKPEDYSENGEVISIDGFDLETAKIKALDVDGSKSDYTNPEDICCAYYDNQPNVYINDNGEKEEDEGTPVVFYNPARIFRRIMCAYNNAYKRQENTDTNLFKYDIEECQWITGLDTIQQDETAAEYITRVLCKKAITYGPNLETGTSNGQVAGFQYYCDVDGHHFKRLNYTEATDDNTISLHFGAKDSRVISFTANNVGALVMAGYNTKEYGEIMASQSGVDPITGDLYDTEAIREENLAKYNKDKVNINNIEVDKSYTEVLAGENNLIKITSSSTAESLSADYTDTYTNLQNLPFQAQLTVWGEYSSTIKPGSFINLLTYDINGQSHYTTGYYYITEVVDSVSSEGYIQTITMVKNLTAYTPFGANADDTTGSNSKSSSGEVVSLTPFQQYVEDYKNSGGDTKGKLEELNNKKNEIPKKSTAGGGGGAGGR